MGLWLFLCYMSLHQWEQRGSNTFRKTEPHPKQSCIFCSFEGKNKGNACLTSRRVKQSCTFSWLYLAGRKRAFCKKMSDRIQVKNNEQLGNVETMFFLRQVCVSFCSMYKYVYLRTQQALHSATNVSSRNIACLTSCFIFWRGMAIPRNRCCLKWTKTCSGTLARTTHPKKTRNQRTQMQITWQKKAESRKV